MVKTQVRRREQGNPHRTRILFGHNSPGSRGRPDRSYASRHAPWRRCSFTRSRSLEEAASGKLVEGILASIAKFYSANLGQETKGHEPEGRAGGWPVRAPFGYRNVRRDGGRRGGESVLEPDQQTPDRCVGIQAVRHGLTVPRGPHRGPRREGPQQPPGQPAEASARSTGYCETPCTPASSAGRASSTRASTSRSSSARSSTGCRASWTRTQPAESESRKHDHYLRGTAVCAECGSRLYYTVAKGRFGYCRCIGRNTERTRCSQDRYVPAAELERAVETLYYGVMVPPALRRWLERVLHV